MGRSKHLSKDSVSFDLLHELVASLSLEDVVEEASEKPTVIFEGLERDLLCNIVCGVRHCSVAKERDVLCLGRTEGEQEQKLILLGVGASF